MNDPTNSRYRYLAFKDNGIYRRYIQEHKDEPLRESTWNPKSHEIPAHGTYGALLFDPRWKSKRLEILKRDSYSCMACKKNKNLQIHHRQYHFLVRENQYKAPWDYDNYLLISLCELCHKRGHSIYKVPTIIK
jgi:hypothetical protein